MRIDLRKHEMLNQQQRLANVTMQPHFFLETESAKSKLLDWKKTKARENSIRSHVLNLVVFNSQVLRKAVSHKPE